MPWASARTPAATAGAACRRGSATEGGAAAAISSGYPGRLGPRVLRSALAGMSSFLKRQAGQAARLRELLARPEPVLAPGAFDALSARLIEAAGFPAVYMTGFGTA